MNIINETKDKYEDELRSNGLKVTPGRLAVLHFLAQNDEPTSAEHIYQSLPNSSGINLSTVYRTLTSLEEKGIITKISVMGNEKMLYAYNSLEHRHYLICVKCRKIVTINGCPLHEYENILAKETGFDILGHNLYLYGYCSKCKQSM